MVIKKAFKVIMESLTICTSCGVLTASDVCMLSAFKIIKKDGKIKFLQFSSQLTTPWSTVIIQFRNEELF